MIKIQKDLPTQREMIPDYLIELHNLGGSATVREVMEKLGERFKLSEEQLQITTEKNSQSTFLVRVYFIKTRLHRAGYLESLSSPVWDLSRQGKEIIPDLLKWDKESNSSKLEEFTNEVYEKYGKWQKIKSKSKKEKDTIDDKSSIEEELEEEPDVKQEVEREQDIKRRIEEELDIIIEKMDPYAFERLCRKLLKAMGLRGVKNTKGSGDGGIDGYGFLSFGLVRFKVVFQAKRKKRGKNITPALIRSLSGAKQSEQDKAVFITTSDFTQPALDEAARLCIECISGERLIKLLQKYELGYIKEFDTNFFKSL